MPAARRARKQRAPRRPKVPQEQGGAALLRWLHEERRSQQWLADELSSRVAPIRQTSISGWIGGSMPGASYAAAIEAMGGPAVSLWGKPRNTLELSGSESRE